ncbi:hypothetical protein BDN72DRAFT_368998 [Pluteus cervinus]|uniref:Uncharacterized protein n=1 Tax=Pluteus cervinus TaxID=181527 RepID=A0ACD3BDL0_9AGAR|nr:hypothetical protein BDN72DRAFT_368998 [Pluteus cervinus]
MLLPWRTVFYGLALVLSLFENIVTVLAIANNRSSDGLIAYIIASVISCATWSWMGALLFYNNRPRSRHVLTRAYSHFLSSTFLAVLWLFLSLVISIMYKSSDCSPGSDGLPCVSMNVASLGAWVVLVSVSLCAYSTYRAVHVSNDRWGNIAAPGGREKVNLLEDDVYVHVQAWGEPVPMHESSNLVN